MRHGSGDYYQTDPISHPELRVIIRKNTRFFPTENRMPILRDLYNSQLTNSRPVNTFPMASFEIARELRRVRHMASLMVPRHPLGLASIAIVHGVFEFFWWGGISNQEVFTLRNFISKQTTFC